MVDYLGAFHGTITQLGEEFVHTMAIQSASPQLAVAEALRDHFESEWVADLTNWPGMVSNNVIYTHTTAAEILSPGPVDPALAASSRADFVTTVQGQGGAQMSNADSIAVSMTAGVYPNGRPVRGRFYTPPPHVGVGSGGILAATEQSTILGYWERVITNLGTSGFTAGVWSRVLGEVQPITTLRVGDLLDDMPSRRNARGEQYTSVGI